MRNIYKISMLLLFILMLALVGCGQSSDSETGDEGKTSSSQTTETGDGDSTLVIAQPSDVSTMDPQDSLSTTGDRVFRNTYSRLFYWDDDMELQNDAVDSYEQIDDETWIFTLKDGITFHNGDSLTAEDVEYSLNRVMTDESLKEFPYFTQLQEVKAIDDLQVEITTDGPMPTLLNLLAKSGSDILPKQYIEEVGFDEFMKNPIGSGPYKIVEWKIDDRVILEPYGDYFGDEPKWDEVVVRAIPENSTRVAELLTGGVDIITDVPPNEWERIDGSDDADLESGTTTRVVLLVVRTTDGYVTADPKVREAIDLAINNEILVESILQGSGVPVRTRVPEEVFGSNIDLYDSYLYDLERAKELLAEAGYPDGVDITFTASRDRYMLDAEVAEAVSAMLGEAGFNVNLEVLESSAYLDVYNSNSNEELFMIALADGLLDASYSLVHYTKDRAEGQTDYYNKEVEELYHAAGRNLDFDERAEQYQKIQEIVAEERPHIFLYQGSVNYGVKADINFTPRLDEIFRYDDISRN